MSIGWAVRGGVAATLTAALTVAAGTGAVAAAPGAYVEPNRLGFGAVAVGETEVDTVEVVNSSKKPVTITGAGSSQAFWPTWTPTGTRPCELGLALAPGQSCKLQYAFAPTAPGRYSSRLSITFADATSAGFRLTGQGV